MNKKFIISYFLIFATLIGMMSLSKRTSEKMRGDSVSLFAPVWEKLLAFKYFIFHPSLPSPFTQLSLKEELERIQLDNRLLETEIDYLQKQLQEQVLISSQIAQIAPFVQEEASELRADYQSSLQAALKTMKKRIQGVPARVIFRSFDSWNTYLWINAGRSANSPGEKPVIAINSPVIVGKAIAGIVDYVGEHQARVRLISDSRLTPSVRASRGGESDFLIAEQIERLEQLLSRTPSLTVDKTQLCRMLQEMKMSLSPLKKTWRLAKGVLLGSLESGRPGGSVILKGTGFNYDFADEEGPSRDLRSGLATEGSSSDAVPILRVNDILITTGMDGVFPPGFQAAVVTRVGVLKEGDYYYDLEAQPIGGPLEELSLVFVLPPVSEEQTIDLLRN